MSFKKNLIEILCVFIPNKDIRSNVRKTLRAISFFKEFRDYLDFRQTNLGKNSVLIIEPNPCHAECLPSYVKYFKEKNYQVHIITTIDNKQSGCFAKVPKRFLPDKIWGFDPCSQKFILKNKKIFDYSAIFLATSEHYYSDSSYLDYLGFEPKCKGEFYIMEHDNRNIERFAEQKFVEKKQLVMITNFQKDESIIEFVPDYFGEVNITPKNGNVINFISVGAMEQKRRNVSLLIESVEKLRNARINNFVITIIGGGKKLCLPDSIKKYFDIKGKLNYQEMYEEMENADFFLPLLDPTIAANRDYLCHLTTGSKQLISGFKKPCLINDEFAKVYGFDDSNAIVYKQNDLFLAMQKAISIIQANYESLQNKIISKGNIINV